METVSNVDLEFIDVTDYKESLENYYAFENISRECDDAIENSFAGFDFSQEPSKYFSDDEICNEVPEFKDSKKRLRSLIKLW